MTNAYHYVKTLREDRNGRARRGTDTTAKKYNLTYCGRELTDRELDEQYFTAPECRVCVRVIDGGVDRK